MPQPMTSLGRYGPPLALMALIWVLSSIETLDSGLSFDFELRKLGHAAVFGVLYALWWRVTTPAYAAIIAVGWAALDEHHQSWVEGRHGTVYDVLIDSVGIAVAAAVLARWRARASRARSR